MTETYEGGCSCGHVRYRMTSKPLIVHCCHCSWCQTQTGSAFVLNALIETDRVELLKGDVELIDTPSPSGKGQDIARCPKCEVAVWSHYYMGGARDFIRFVRVGTLDEPGRLPPDVHIFTKTKLPWFQYPEGQKVVEDYYETEETWSPESLKRREAIIEAFERASS